MDAILCDWGRMDLLAQSLSWLKSQYGPGCRFKNRLKMAEFLGLDEKGRVKLYKALQENKPSVPQSDTIFLWLDKLGVALSMPEDKAMPQTRDIEFINPKIVSVENGCPPPVSQDYIAAPLAEEAIAAGPGRIPQDAIRGWVVVWRHQGALRYKTDLVAVEIGKGQTSMEPNLHPGDIVLVDRADKDPYPDGKIMLVCDPDGGCAVKRVSSRSVDGDVELVFYSDNTQGNPPRVFRLNRDYGGNIGAALGGRVVWAWSDMTRK